jgi:hypothetical protein
MGERVESIPDDDSVDDGLLQEPNGPGACPPFFVAQCHEARKGGASAYEQAGYTLIGAIGGLCPDWLDDEDQWVAALDELEGLIGAGSDDDALSWFDRYLPRCLALVPRRWRASFLSGVHRYLIEEGNSIEY